MFGQIKIVGDGPAAGADLDGYAFLYGLARKAGEADDDLRARIIDRALGPPRSLKLNLRAAPWLARMKHLAWEAKLG